MKDLLRAFPENPGSSVWICQNLSKGSEYRCHLEEMWCTCEHFAQKHRCKKHLPYALHRAKIYFGERQPGRVATLRALIRKEHGPISPAAEFDRFMELVIPERDEEAPIPGWSEKTEAERKRVFA